MAILCGTDFSTNAREAARAGAAMALRLEESICLMHVREPVTWREMLSEEKAALRKAVRRSLKAEAQQLRNLGVEVDEEIRVGLPDEELADRARSAEVRLVVVGALGRRSVSRWLLGSIAERTVQISSVPVLVVRVADGFAAWARGKRPLRIMVGMDRSAGSDTALHWTGALSRRGPCEIVVAHVYSPAQERRRLALPSTTEGDRPDPDVERALTAELTARAADSLSEASWRLELQAGSDRAACELVELARRENSDVLVVGTRQRSPLARLWHGAVTYGVLHAAPMSVACVPAPEGA